MAATGTPWVGRFAGARRALHAPSARRPVHAGRANSAICGCFSRPVCTAPGNRKVPKQGRMLDKAHKPSGKPLWAALARLCSLPLSVLLSTCAFGGAAYAAGPNASATAGVGSVPVQDQARDLPRPPPSGAAHLTGAPTHTPGQHVGVDAVEPTGEASRGVGQALRSTVDGAANTTLAATTRAGSTRSRMSTAVQPATGSADTYGKAPPPGAIGITPAAPGRSAARAVPAVPRLARHPESAPARAAIRALLPHARESASAAPSGAGEVFRRARETLSGGGRPAIGAGGAVAGVTDAVGSTSELLVGAIEGSPETASGLPLLLPSVPGIPLLIPISGEPPGIPFGGPASQALASVLAPLPPAPAPESPTGAAALAGGSEASLPGAAASAGPSSTLRPGSGPGRVIGALGCAAAGTEGPAAGPCAVARTGLARQRAGPLPDANAGGIPPRAPPVDSDGSGIRLDSPPPNMLAGSRSGTMSGGSVTSAAGGPGFALASLLTLAALLSMASPRILRRLALASERWLADPLALIPERPG